MILVIGEILFDIFPDYERIGGAPFNFAFHLKKLGFPVRMISRVGDDRKGREILAMAEKNGFDTADIQVDARHPTGTVNVTLDDAGVPHFDIRRNVAYDHLDLNPPALTGTENGEMVYFGTLLQRTESACRQVADFLRRQGDSVMRFCDVNMRPPHVNLHAVAESLTHTDLLKLSEDELEKIQNEFGGPTDNRSSLQWLMETYAIHFIALTQGDQGSTFAWSDRVIHSPAIAADTIVDTVGAGDGYAAILAAGYLLGADWQMTIEQASRFAGRLCGIAGAVPDDHRFYDDFASLSFHPG